MGRMPFGVLADLGLGAAVPQLYVPEAILPSPMGRREQGAYPAVSASKSETIFSVTTSLSTSAYTVSSFTVSGSSHSPILLKYSFLSFRY